MQTEFFIRVEVHKHIKVPENALSSWSNIEDSLSDQNMHSSKPCNLKLFGVYEKNKLKYLLPKDINKQIFV